MGTSVIESIQTCRMLVVTFIYSLFITFRRNFDTNTHADHITVTITDTIPNCHTVTLIHMLMSCARCHQFWLKQDGSRREERERGSLVCLATGPTTLTELHCTQLTGSQHTSSVLY